MNRAEKILQTVTTLLTGLTTTGNNVTRTRFRTINVTPHLSIEMGENVTNNQGSTNNFMKRELDIKIISHVEDNDDADTILNQISGEVFAAMMADITLGLPYVTDVDLVSDNEPEFTGDGAKKIGTQQMNYTIEYKHPWTSTEE